MPLYEARSLDVLGNPVDGYEVNDTRRLGEVYIPPHPETQTGLFEAFSQHVLGALADRGWTSSSTEGYEVRDEDEAIGILSHEEAFVGDNDNDGPRFIAMSPISQIDRNAAGNETGRRMYHRARAAAEEQLHEDEELLLEEGDRPALSLHPQELTDQGPAEAEVEFWNVVYEYSRDARQRRARGPCGSCRPPGILQEMESDRGVNTERCDECDIYPDDEHARVALAKLQGYNLSIELGFYADTQRIGVEVRAGDVDEGEGNTSDRFEWDLAEWQRHPTFGFDPVTSEPLAPTAKQVEEILVALDHFMTTGRMLGTSGAWFTRRNNSDRR